MVHIISLWLACTAIVVSCTEVVGLTKESPQVNPVRTGLGRAQHGVFIATNTYETEAVKPPVLDAESQSGLAPSSKPEPRELESKSNVLRKHKHKSKAENCCNDCKAILSKVKTSAKKDQKKITQEIKKMCKDKNDECCKKLLKESQKISEGLLTKGPGAMCQELKMCGAV